MSPEVATKQSQIEGLVEKVEWPEGKQGRLSLGGQVWFLETNEKYRRAWVDPKPGMTVRLSIDPWTKNDGSTAFTVKGIEDISPFEEADTSIEVTPYARHGDFEHRGPETYSSKRSATDRSIQNQVALKAAVDTMITAFVDSDPDARIDMVLRAYAAYSSALGSE